MSTSPSVPDSQNVAPLDDVLSSSTPFPLSAEAVDPVTRLLHAAEGLALLRVRMLPVTRNGAAGPVVSDTEICDECQRQRVLSGMAHAGSCMVGQVLQACAAVRAAGARAASAPSPAEELIRYMCKHCRLLISPASSDRWIDTGLHTCCTTGPNESHPHQPFEPSAIAPAAEESAKISLTEAARIARGNFQPPSIPIRFDGLPEPVSPEGWAEYVRRPQPPVKAVRWTGDNLADVRKVYPGLGEEYLRDKGCRVGDYVVCPQPGQVRFWNPTGFENAYQPVAAPIAAVRQLRPLLLELINRRMSSQTAQPTSPVAGVSTEEDGEVVWVYQCDTCRHIANPENLGHKCRQCPGRCIRFATSLEAERRAARDSNGIEQLASEVKALKARIRAQPSAEGDGTR